MPAFVLGISAFYHDSAAALLRDGEIVAAAQEERFTRKKHDAGFPKHAVDFALQQAGIGIGDVDFVAIYPMAARIEELSLARSSVTDAGVMSMPSLPNARSVRLDNTGLTDVGITAVLSRTLDAEVVNLVNTPATDRAFTALGQLPYLRKVYLYGTKVSPDGVAAFRQARPGVEVNVGGTP